MVKDTSDGERGNLLLSHELLLPINSKGSFICMLPQTGLHIPRLLVHQSWSTGWNENTIEIISSNKLYVNTSIKHNEIQQILSPT